MDSLLKSLTRSLKCSVRGLEEIYKCFVLIVDHKEHSGFFAEEFETQKLEVFCPWIGGDLQVFDVNHDGYDDLICHTSTGMIQISEIHIVNQLTGGITDAMDGADDETGLFQK